MNFVSSMPASRIGLESAIYQVFGTHVSSEIVIVAATLAAITVLFKSSLISSGLR